jgi:lysophospholipase L1-like esterase
MSIAGKHVLIIGDSLTAYDPGLQAGPLSTKHSPPSPGVIFGAKLLAAGAASVRRNSRIGRSAYSLFNQAREHGDAQMKAEAVKPTDVVVVFLGTNDLSVIDYHNGAGLTEKYMNRIKAYFPGKEFWTIGPPTCAYRNKDGVRDESQYPNANAPTVIDVEKRVFGADRFIDARPLTADILTPAQGRESEGVHFQASGAELFADRLYKAFLALDATAPAVAVNNADWLRGGVSAYTPAGVLLSLASQGASGVLMALGSRVASGGFGEASSPTYHDYCSSQQKVGPLLALAKAARDLATTMFTALAAIPGTDDVRAALVTSEKNFETWVDYLSQSNFTSDMATSETGVQQGVLCTEAEKIWSLSVPYYQLPAVAQALQEFVDANAAAVKPPVGSALPWVLLGVGVVGAAAVTGVVLWRRSKRRRVG